MITILFLFSIVFPQVVPFESSSVFTSNNELQDVIHITDKMIDNSIDINLKESLNILAIESQIIYESKIVLESLNTVTIDIGYSYLPYGTKFFLIDNNTDGVIGPFYTTVNDGFLRLGPIHSTDFIIQYIAPNIIDKDLADIYISLGVLRNGHQPKVSPHLRTLRVRKLPAL